MLLIGFIYKLLLSKFQESEGITLRVNCFADSSPALRVCIHQVNMRDVRNLYHAQLALNAPPEFYSIWRDVLIPQ